MLVLFLLCLALRRIRSLSGLIVTLFLKRSPATPLTPLSPSTGCHHHGNIIIIIIIPQSIISVNQKEINILQMSIS
jgi:hypothetical protein